jgi:hypothetical protein
MMDLLFSALAKRPAHKLDIKCRIGQGDQPNKKNAQQG